MENILYIFKIFKSNNKKVCPVKNFGNRERSKTEYDYEDYEDILHEEFKRKFDFKHNKISSLLRIRGSSF